MSKNSHGRILTEELKEQHLSIVLKSCLKTSALVSSPELIPKPTYSCCVLY